MKKIDGRSKAARVEKLKSAKAARAERFTGLEDGDWGDSVLGRAKVAKANEHLNKMLREHREYIDSIGIEPQEPKTTVLQEAHDLIYGQREQDYGDPKKNLNDIGDLWTAFIRAKYEVDLVLYPEDVCNMMVLLKMARGFNGSKKRDNSVDMAGYIGLIERIER